MHPQAYERLWQTAGGKLPHLSREVHLKMGDICGEGFKSGEGEHWGLVYDATEYRGHHLLRCFNYGNARVDYPWDARLINFGVDAGLEIVGCGTVRRPYGRGTALDRLDAPFVVFEYKANSQVQEYLQPGLLVTAAEKPLKQQRMFDVALADDARPVQESGVLYYYLSRRIRFVAEPQDRWVAEGATRGYLCMRITLSEAVCLEPGWRVLMLTRAGWTWGVVVR